MDSHRRFKPRGLGTLVCIVSLALLAGCGSDDASDKGATSGGGASTGAASTPATGEEQAVRDTIEQYYASFQKPTEYCSFVSERLAKTLGGGDAEKGREACEKGQERFARAGATRKVKEIKRVTVKGQKATATTSVETSPGNAREVTHAWVKQGGEWKLDKTVQAGG